MLGFDKLFQSHSATSIASAQRLYGFKKGKSMLAEKSSLVTHHVSRTEQQINKKRLSKNHAI